MTKTIFSDTPPLGTVVTAAFLNLLNNHRHAGTDTDGDGALDYAVSSGSANAYAITLALALTANIQGMPIRFKANFTNTGAVTLAINGMTAVALKKNVNAPLVAGDIQSGQIYTVCFDGTYFQVFNGTFLGVNDFAANLSGNGFQKLPGGYIQQWGYCITDSNGIANVTFPTPFLVACYGAYPSAFVSGPVITANHAAPITTGASFITWALSGAVAPTISLYWNAIGK
jgi:hypothetical protein